jgi:ribosomal protein L32
MTNNKQQTAVEWFHQKTWALKIQLEKGEISIGEYANTYATLYEQAKEMEKEQRSIKLPSDLLCINCDESKSSHNVCMDCIIKIGRQNIELPSDEEIEDASLEENNDDLSPAEEFQSGAKWMRNKIQGGEQ